MVNRLTDGALLGFQVFMKVAFSRKAAVISLLAMVKNDIFLFFSKSFITSSIDILYVCLL